MRGCARVVASAILLTLLAAGTSALAATSDYTHTIPPESPAAREARHARVAARRAQGVIIIAHRGARTLAPENTLEAYAAAMDYGADGCEADIRRTADGVLVMFHDDMLDRLTDAFGRVEDLSYAELATLQIHSGLGTFLRGVSPPTFAAFLTLARQRAMLLHLDVKARGLAGPVARMLDDADMWDHVVAISTETLPEFVNLPRLKLLQYKGGIYEGRRDVDPAAIQAVLLQPGKMLILEDPRVTARQLGRKPYQPVPLPAEAFAGSKPVTMRMTSEGTEDLIAVLFDTKDRRERIVERARAAQRLGELGNLSRRVVEALEYQVRRPTYHPEWILNALDRQAAARALGQLHSTESAPVLIEAFRRVDPELAEVRNPQGANEPLAWVDWRKSMILPILGELPCKASKDYLLEYVTLSETAARQIAMPQFEEATLALLRQQLNRPELLRLLQSANSAVRGTAILDCLDNPRPEHTAALRASAPWALELPRPKVNSDVTTTTLSNR
jgi:HEAT repeat protein